MQTGASEFTTIPFLCVWGVITYVLQLAEIVVVLQVHQGAMLGIFVHHITVICQRLTTLEI